jgi:hypothetical protein
MEQQAMSPETTTDRGITLTDPAVRDLPAQPQAAAPPPRTGPLSGLERAAFFAALRRKADQRIAGFG